MHGALADSWVTAAHTGVALHLREEPGPAYAPCGLSQTADELRSGKACGGACAESEVACPLTFCFTLAPRRAVRDGRCGQACGTYTTCEECVALGLGERAGVSTELLKLLDVSRGLTLSFLSGATRYSKVRILQSHPVGSVINCLLAAVQLLPAEPYFIFQPGYPLGTGDQPPEPIPSALEETLTFFGQCLVRFFEERTVQVECFGTVGHEATAGCCGSRR